MQERIIDPTVYPAPSSIADDIRPGASGVSWAAIFAGAAAGAALSVVLIILGVGLGLSAVSPWTYAGASAATIGVSTVVWLAVTQIVASGAGGYLAGRLRVKWTDVNSNEVYFRDTAHGMLSWAVSTLLAALFMGSALSGIVSGGAQLAATTGQAALSAGAGLATKASGDGEAMPYFVDKLLRTDKPGAGASPTQVATEVTQILATSLHSGALSEQDAHYLGQLVADRSGLNQAEAQARVTDIYARVDQAMKDLKTTAKTDADLARKASAMAALWMVVALLCGAFCASLFAVYGGRRRDAAWPVQVSGRRQSLS